jgi:hypothetical protein
MAWIKPKPEGRKDEGGDGLRNQSPRDLSSFSSLVSVNENRARRPAITATEFVLFFFDSPITILFSAAGLGEVSGLGEVAESDEA